MQIKNVPIKEIIPYERNNRVHSDQQIDRIAKSITDFGFNQPLVLDETNTVLVGHGRLLAAKKLGIKEAPVYRAIGLTKAQKKAYRILDNKLQNDSTWDFDSLGIELSDLKELGFDLEAFGLDELHKLFPVDEAEVKEDDFDPDSVDTTECYIKRGDLIEIGAHRVMCGDSTSDDDIKELMKGQKAQAIITDPPYGVDYDGGTTTREKLAGDNNTALYPPTCRAAFLNSDDKSPLYLFHAGIKGYSAAAAAAAAGYEIRCELIWNKNQAQFGALSAQYKQKHEPFYYCYKKGKTARWYGPTNEVTVWDCNRSSKNEFHPTQKPVELIGRAIKNSTAKNDIILDLFLGSGTTLIAADQLGRICYGMEIEPKYCQVIIERYTKYCEGKNRKAVVKINGKPYAP